MDEHVNPDDRWAKEAWNSYELFEKIRIRKRRRTLWMGFVVSTVFLSLCAIPVVRERLPQWNAVRASREIVLLLEEAKILAQKERIPVRLKFETDRVNIDFPKSCTDPLPTEFAKTWSWTQHSFPVQLMDSSLATQNGLGVKLLEFCFDPVLGVSQESKSSLVVIPSVDIPVQRLDRISVVTVDGADGRIQLN